MSNKQTAEEPIQKLIDWIDKEILINPYYDESARLRIGAEMVKVKANELLQEYKSQPIQAGCRWVKASEYEPKSDQQFHARWVDTGEKFVVKWTTKHGYSISNLHLSICEIQIGDEPPPSSSLSEVIGEWQLCPKCNGDGNLPSPSTTVMYITCDVCNGQKIIAKPTTSHYTLEDVSDAWDAGHDKGWATGINSNMNLPNKETYLNNLSNTK